MLNTFKGFFRKKYKVLNKIEISKSALLHNYSQLSTLNSHFHIAPVLKSNAYGHGIKEVGEILDSVNAPFFCVDSLYEAYQLYKPVPFLNKIKTPILIMGYTNPENLKWRKLPFEWAVWDLEFAKALNEYQNGAKVHIFVDTGMSREGVTLENLPKFLFQLNSYKNLRIAGLMSHLASANSLSDPLLKHQLKNFKKAKQILEKSETKVRFFHIGGSSLLFSKKLYTSLNDLVNVIRVGRAVYGIGPNSKSKLLPVYELKTTIAQVKKIKKGESVGYDGTTFAKQNLVLAILPIGYFDGVDRRLSNKGFVKIKNTFCPIIGLVSMNMTTIDVSKVKKVKVGDEVLVYSRDMKDKNSALATSEICQTTPSEILSSLIPSTRRVVVD